MEFHVGSLGLTTMSDTIGNLGVFQHDGKWYIAHEPSGLILAQGEYRAYMTTLATCLSQTLSKAFEETECGAMRTRIFEYIRDSETIPQQTNWWLKRHGYFRLALEGGYLEDSNHSRCRDH